MKIQVRQVGDVAVLQPAGKLTMSGDGFTLRAAVQDAVHSGTAMLVLHLGAVTRADSSGIGDLVSANTLAKNSGATIKLSNVPSHLAQPLTVTQLIQVFDVYDTEAEAMASFPR